ncbi:hypothetical protein FPV67DRAFT_569371 [Lyophyllum atratum]|nr:hypothetical protein FPV67DRAFT_569371 [Lyophyllum atratum]
MVAFLFFSSFLKLSVCASYHMQYAHGRSPRRYVLVLFSFPAYITFLSISSFSLFSSGHSDSNLFDYLTIPGISAATGLPYSPPTDFRITPRSIE